ncbi:benzoate/H(+) symporter BenE family transporter [Streptomyces sp. YGL11-2]|uniref:benzoate/H(+) symporter BenE family transporter n=1 Tax=Streptomyces sp. YGL11-2 TaxID=3414028 RepID=UPI003CEF30A4
MTSRLRSAAPATAVTAGFLAVLIGVTSSVAIVATAAQAAGATPKQLTSWMLALGVGMGVTCLGLSLRYKAPVITAWSTPGAALLATGLHGVSMAQAIGAFLFSAVLIVLSGVTGWFARVMDRIPVSLASALLAGVLVQFGTGLFTKMQESLVVVLPMFAVYLLGRRWLPRYAVIAALVVGVAVSAAQGALSLRGLHLEIAEPVFVRPEFSWQVLVGVGLPLYVVTMASQNLPGVAVLRNAGYRTPISPLLTWTGVVNALLAPFGCFGLNLAAITAAICTGEEAHRDPRKRYAAGVWAGVFYLAVGLFGGVVGWLLSTMPTALVMGIAGLGLLGTIGGSLNSALSDERTREAAVITFLATASGMTLFGIGSTFWGLLAGVLAAAVLNWRRRAATPPPPQKQDASQQRQEEEAEEAEEARQGEAVLVPANGAEGERPHRQETAARDTAG